MSTITLECPHCHEIITGDPSWYGQPVKCLKYQETILVPPMPVNTELQAARLIPERAAAPPVLAKVTQETEIFRLSPVARAFPGQILLGMSFLAVAVGLALRAEDFSWPLWVPLIPLALGLLVLLLLLLRVKSCSYRLSTERLFVRRGWLGKHVNELELYRVKDVVVDQGSLQRLLGYGTITVWSEDESTPELVLRKVSRPTHVKELIRTQYRAARQREGVHPTEFMQS